MNFRVMKTLIERELREHRALIWAPLITAIVIIGTAVLSSTVSGGLQVSIDGDSSDFMAMLSADGEHQRAVFSVWMAALVLPQMLIAMIVVFFYLLDSLYTERKDRSILFWKSMPVSDLQTVASKVLTGLVVVPLGVWALSLVTGLLVFLVASLKLAGTPLAPLAEFHVGAWFILQAVTLQNTVVASLWYAPIAGYLLVVSVYAKRNPFLWAVLPPLLLVIFENAAFDTSRVAGFLVSRMTEFFAAVSIRNTSSDAATGDALQSSITAAYDALGALELLARLDLWLGVVVAAVLVLLAARLRRWRDDA